MFDLSEPAESERGHGMKNAITINGIEYEEGDTIKSYWLWDEDHEPRLRLKVENGELVLFGDSADMLKTVKSVEDANYLAAVVLDLWRGEILRDLYRGLRKRTVVNEDAWALYNRRVKFSSDEMKRCMTETRQRAGLK